MNPTEPEIVNGSSTVEDLAKRYLAKAFARVEEETARRSIAPALGTLTFFIGPLKLSEVTVERADAYETHLFQNFKRNTVRHKLAVAKGLFLYAVNMRAILISPFQSIKLPRYEKTGRNLSEELIVELLSHIAPKYRKAVKLGLYTGMRRSEVVYLDWDTEIFDTYIRIPPERSKSRRERLIPIGNRVRKILGPRKHGRVFDFCRETLTAVVVKAWHKMGKGRIRFHDLRGTSHTHFMEICHDSAAARAIYGWSKESSSEPYQHLTPKRVEPFLHMRFKV